MALEIIRGVAKMSELVADRRLFLTADKAQIVEEGSAEGAYLFATPGMTIPAGDVERYGLQLVDGVLVVGGSAASETDPERDAEVPDDTPARAPKSSRRR